MTAGFHPTTSSAGRVPCGHFALPIERTGQMYREINENSDFAADYNYFVQQGADPELVAMVAPLLRGEDDGGTEAAYKAAGRYLQQQSGYSPMRDHASMQQARAQALELLDQFGQEVDADLIRRYAPNDAAMNEFLDANYGSRGTGPISLPGSDPNDALQGPKLRDTGSPQGYQPINLSNERRQSPIDSYASFGPRPYWEFEE